MLEPHVQRIRTLHLQSPSTSSESRKTIADTWLSYANIQLPMSLFQETPPDSLLSIDEPRPDPRASRSKDAGQVTVLPLFVTTLHLKGTMLPWTSYAYHNLVDLTLRSRWRLESVSQLQLAGLFSASPALATLKIIHQRIARTEESLLSIPTLLSRLKLLVLRLEAGSLERFLPLISVPDSEDLSVGVTVYGRPQVALEAFFSRFKMATLYCYHPFLMYHRLRLSLLRSLTRVSTVLILRELSIDGKYYTTGPESRSFTSLIPNVMLVSCKVTFEGLKGLVTEHQIHNLRLQCCVLQTSIPESQSLEDIRILLLEIYPDLEVSIEDTDSTYGHPVRHWDEYGW
ncbi:hypothetical protein FRC12_006550 [Ceratobasidium sp. 428]|nr:hypothetical protein FRC12_006550 [Ceratobasidium sp. 428]